MKTGNRNRIHALVGVIACGMLGNVAMADIYVRDRAGGENSNGNPNGVFQVGTGGTVQLKFNSGQSFYSQALGMYDFQMNKGMGWESLLSFCIDPFQYLSIAGPSANPGTPHTEVSLHGYADINDDEEELIETLWANAFELAKTSKKKAAAFQVILWETAIDNTFNLSGGNFQVKNHNYSGEVLALANSWVNNIINGTWTDQQELHVLSSSRTQDLLVPVPAPGAMLLGLIGLSVAGAVKRKFGGKTTESAS